MAYSLITDRELLCLVQANDHKAFTEIYLRYWKKMFSVAANKLQDIALAEELVQDIFCDLWNRRASMNITQSLGAYLAVATKYKIIDARLKTARAKAANLKLTQNASELDSSTEELLHFEELKDQLARLVVSLPEKSRLVYQLSREIGLPHKQIAQNLRISEKTVEYHLSRAISTIRKGLSHFICFLF